jgi:3-deoxy-manno-octulosonate cytidylyltransferase (CMP-KDO synthetase)
MLRALGVIPARFASTRFPGKPLAPLGNGSLLSAVWSAAEASSRLTRVIVATEDARIVDACRGYGAEAMLTSPDHASGTDRAAEVVRRVGEPFDVVVNIQGDEPFVTPTSLDTLVAAFDGRPQLSMATLAEPLDAVEDLADPGVVKVVVAHDGKALYFSRSPIPYHRESGGKPAGTALAGYLKHQGIYAYRTETLFKLTGLPPSPLELAESLEQLRALQAGIGIQVLSSDFKSIAVDTPADLARAAARFSSRQEITR